MSRRRLALLAAAVAAVVSSAAAAQDAAGRPSPAPKKPAAGAPGAAAPAPAPKPEETPTYDFVRHQVVLLKHGPAWTAEKTPALDELQRQHLGHLQKMWESGKLVVAGPFESAADPTWLGLCLYAVETPAEARTLAEQDPGVKAGRFVVEVATWMTQRGVMSFKPAPAKK